MGSGAGHDGAVCLCQAGGLGAQATFSEALAWPYLYPWPQRPAGLVEAAFDELALRWMPILERAEECGVDLWLEIHPGEDLHDGVSFEMFLDRVGGHDRANMRHDPSHHVLQCLDYIENLEIYRDRIRMFHVKDAELNPTRGRASTEGSRAGSIGPAVSGCLWTGMSISERCFRGWRQWISRDGPWSSGSSVWIARRMVLARVPNSFVTTSSR